MTGPTGGESAERGRAAKSLTKIITKAPTQYLHAAGSLELRRVRPDCAARRSHPCFCAALGATRGGGASRRASGMGCRSRRRFPNASITAQTVDAYHVRLEFEHRSCNDWGSDCHGGDGGACRMAIRLLQGEWDLVSRRRDTGRVGCNDAMSLCALLTK